MDTSSDKKHNLFKQISWLFLCWIYVLPVLVFVLLPAVFFPEVNLYKSMGVNLLRRLYVRPGYGGTLSPLVTEHLSSAQWRLSRAVTPQSLLTPSPQSKPLDPPPLTSSYSSQNNEVLKIDSSPRDKRSLKEMYCCRSVVIFWVAHSVSASSLSGCPFGIAVKHFFLRCCLKGGCVSLHWKVDLIAPSFIM